ncbi:MAG: RodZ domain-containing protein [Kiloniellaceae bacterium]
MAVTQRREQADPTPRLGEGLAAPRESVSTILRYAREDYGQDLRTVAQILRIRYFYLEAIESGRFDELPGTTYAVGFLRSYADFLGLDGSEIVERFKEETEGVEKKPELIFPEPVTEGKVPGGAIILISVLLLGLAYGGWFYLSNQGKSIADLIPPLPERLQALLTDDEAPGVDNEAVTAEVPENAAVTAEVPAGDDRAASAGAAETESHVAAAEDASAGEPPVQSEPGSTLSPSDMAPDQAPPGAAVETGETPVPPAAPRPATAQSTARPAAPQPSTASGATRTTDSAETAGASGPAQTATADPPAAAPPDSPTGTRASTPSWMPDYTLVIPAVPTRPQTVVIPDTGSPRVYGERTENTRIILRAVQDSWVQVRDSQDALLLTRVLRPGDVYFVPNQEGLTLLTGNAGGIEIEVDGITVPPVGPVGTVRRHIALDPVRLRNGTAAPR